MTKSRRILVAPLDWGLGHASRCIPIIQELIRQGAEVIIGADKMPLLLLQEEFPDLETVCIPGFEITYPNSQLMGLAMAQQAPGFLKHIKFEQEFILKQVEKLNLDGIISDNRYGLYHSSVPSVLITHQLNIKAYWLSAFLRKMTREAIQKFNDCWVPDFENEPSLSGSLSHGNQIPKNVSYIGPLSKFTDERNSEVESVRDLIVVLSGPEPSRTKFESLLLKQLQQLQIKALIVRGLVQKDSTNLSEVGKLRIVDFMGKKELEEEILRSKLILCRSGYSSIMDLYALKKKAILVPTPGQTEQEFLAKDLHAKGLFFSCKESELNLDHQLKETEKFSGFSERNEESFLERKISQLLNPVHH